MEGEETLKQKKKAGTKLKAYRLYIKKKICCDDLFLCKMSYVSCKVRLKFTDSIDFPVFPVYAIGRWFDRVGSS